MTTPPLNQIFMRFKSALYLAITVIVFCTCKKDPIVPPGSSEPVYTVFVNNEFILDWTGQGQLQSAPAVTGVYTNINPAPNAPYTNAVVPGGNRFFRFAPAP